MIEDSSKELIVIDLIKNGYANYPDDNNKLYKKIEGCKKSNQDKYFGINNKNKNIIDTTGLR